MHNQSAISNKSLINDVQSTVSLKDDDGIFKIKLWKNLLFGLGFFHAVV
jgi:hypothetical protein